jgi:hypothetical protein
MLLKEYIKIYDNIIPVQHIAQILKIYSNKEFQQGRVGDERSNRVDTKLRKTLIYGLGNLVDSLTDVHWFNLLGYYISNGLNLYRQELDPTMRDFCQNRINEIQILKYFEGYFYNYHVDSGGNHHRNMSCIIFLNNDYEGGELVFKDQASDEELEIKVKPGRMILWPSNFLFPHKVREVKKGIRYSIVSWII